VNVTIERAPRLDRTGWVVVVGPVKHSREAARLKERVEKALEEDR
jgi:hypothetical protein